MRLTIVQYGGDYREAWERFEGGGKATYQAQRYSVNLVGSIAQRLENVAVICAVTESAYDVVLPNQVRAIGAGISPGFRAHQLLPLVAKTRPDRLLLTTPMSPILKWARRNHVRTLAQLADSFRGGHVLRQIKNRLLAFELNRSSVDWVSNHGLASCLSLVQIGVRPEKVIPWDWPPSHSPADHEPRRPIQSGSCTLIYVGTVSEPKGVGDLLRAVALLRDKQFPVSLTIVGPEPDHSMRELCHALTITDCVKFAGIISNEDVPAAMRQASIVVIPSRHEYPEGLPLTIYEALAARTPIIASDHPMFRGALVSEDSAVIYPASNPAALAASIQRLAKDDKLYARISQRSNQAWEALQLPVTWGALLEKWISDTPADREWLRAHSLTCGRYDNRLSARRGEH